MTAVLLTTACAHQSEQSTAHEKQLQVMQARLDEAERTNGRLAVRIEELEDDIFLLQDRVDANRIALQRGGVMSPQGSTVSQKPAPTPQTYWGNTAQQAQPERQNPYARQVTRIPLGGGDERDWQPTPTVEHASATTNSYGGDDDAELVITERDFEAFSRGSGVTPTATGTRKAAQPPVTSERLPTTPELAGEAPKKRDALGIYKDALAEYRGGDYRAALQGFEQFLATRPQADYIDNALYWIGECHYGLGAFDTAVSFFQRVMSEQPDGNKVPDAMLKMSLAFDRVGRGEDATRVLEDLNRQYPATNAGKLATQRLAERK